MPPHSSIGGAQRVAAVDEVPDQRPDDADLRHPPPSGPGRPWPRRTRPAVPASSPGTMRQALHRRLERAAGHLAAERHEEVVAGERHAAADHDHLGIEDVEQVGDADAEELGGVVHHLEGELVAVVRGLVDGLRGDPWQVAADIARGRPALGAGLDLLDRAQGDVGARRVGLEAAVVAALAAAALGVDRRVADLARHVRRAVVQLARRG